MKRFFIALGIALVIVFFSGYLLGFMRGSMNVSFKVSSGAAIKTVGVEVFWDIQGMQPIEYVNWGVLEPAETKTLTTYVKSLSNVAVGVSIYSGNWQPPNASEYITLTASPDYFIIEPFEVVQVNLTLSIATYIEGITNFAFEISYMASG